MTTTPTSNPIPSEAPQDVKFNAGKIDEFVTSMGWTYTDRFGMKRYTIEGINNLAEAAISAFGYITIDSFQTGASITLPNQVLRDTSTGEYYRWDGSFPKAVPSGSTPASAGGVGAGAWVSVGDAALRSMLAASDGLKLVGACNDITELRTLTGESNGQQIFLCSYLAGKNLGGGIFQWDSTSTKNDDGGCIIAPTGASTGRWIRQGVTDKTPEMYGAIGDGAVDDTVSIQKMADSEGNHSELEDDFFGSFKLRSGAKYLTSATLDFGNPIKVEAFGAEIIPTNSYPVVNFSMHNGEWNGGYINAMNLSDSQIDDKSVGIYLSYNATNPSIQFMHSKISGLRVWGCHTGIKLGGGAATSPTWMSAIEFSEIAVRAGSSSNKAYGINIDCSSLTGGNSTTLSFKKVSVSRAQGAAKGAGHAGYRVINVNDLKIYDISYDGDTVGYRDILYADCHSLDINGIHIEEITNNTTIGVEAPITFAAATAKIENLVFLNTSTAQNCSWICPLNPTYLQVGNIFQTQKSGSTPHLEYFIDMSRSDEVAVNVTGNVTPSEIYGAKTRQRLSFPCIAVANNVNNKTSVASGGAVVTLLNSNASYELFIRGDSGGTLGFTSRVLCVKARDNGAWTIKSDTVNTEESMPSATYPVTFTASGNNIIFNIQSSVQIFDIQTKFVSILAISDAY